LDCFRQGLARRGFPEKLYTDQGKIFTSYHLQIVCANLGVRICHAQPYAAWSKGKLERWFRSLQMDFEARLIIDPAHTLEEINARLWRWIESEYHQRTHSALEGRLRRNGFAQRALNLRTADPRTDWEALFLSRAQRRVRLDATFSLEGHLWERPFICAANSFRCALIPSSGAASKYGGTTNTSARLAAATNNSRQNLYRPRL